MLSIDKSLADFRNNPENTMNHFTVASVATVLIRLEQKYLANQSGQAKELTISQCIKDIKQRFQTIFENEPTLAAVLNYITTTIDAPANELDRVTVFQNGETIERVILLKETLVLVFMALSDKTAYQVLEPSDAEKDLIDRMRTLYNCLNKLVEAPVCHVGQRNEITFCLNKSYPGVNIIEDINAFLMETLVGFIETKLGLLPAEQQFSLLCQRLHPEETENAVYNKFLAPFKKDAEHVLETRCQDNGINPQDNELRKKITDFIKALSMLPAPVGIHRTGPQARTLFEVLYYTRPHLLDAPLTLCLNRVKADLHACKTFADFTAKGLPQWVDYYELWQAIKKYQALPFLGAEENQLKDVIAHLLTRLPAYFQRFPEADNDTVTAIDTAKQLFIKETSAFKKAHNIGFIENFFGLWDSADKKTRYQLYSRLRHEQEKIRLSDSTLAHYIESNRAGQVLHITPYIINRILLHALLVSPQQWTPVFYACFSRIFTFIRDRFRSEGNEVANAGIADSLLQSSYPTTLIRQLAFLDLVHREPNPGRENLGVAFDGFLIPANLDGIQCQSLEPFIFYMNHMPMVSESAFCRLLRSGDGLLPTLSDIYQLSSVLLSIPEASRITFMQILEPETLKQIIKNGNELANISRQLPEASRMTFIQTLGAETVKQLIKNGGAIANILEQLPEASRMTFIQILGAETVKQIIKDGLELVDILKQLPEASRMTFIQTLGAETVKQLIKNGGAIANILEQLPEASRMTFIQTLGTETVKQLIKNGGAIANILEQLPEASRMTFMQTLGAETLKQIIKDWSHLA